MGRRCCVANCPSTSRLLEHHGVTYHSFPQDPVIRAIWIKNSRIGLDKHITKSVLVCSRHFRRLDFNTIRNGKYLLKARVFPTVFPWGKMEPSEIESDHRALQQANVDGSTGATGASSSASEDVIKDSVETIVAKIMAETAERNAALAATDVKSKEEVDKDKELKSQQDTKEKLEVESPGTSGVDATTIADTGSPVPSTPSSPPKYSNPTNLTIGARLEAQSVDGAWLPARIVEVNETEQTLLVRFDKNSKLKGTPSSSGSFQEWLTIKSDRLRQRLQRVLPLFALEEKCMARWSGPRKFPGTIKKLLGNDTYEVLFDDGYVKNVRAVHMNKLPRQLGAVEVTPTISRIPSPVLSTTQLPVKRSSTAGTASVSSTAVASSSIAPPSSKKSKSTPQRKDWPLLDMANLDIASLCLPEIPKDGEWTCHWVNDQPIGSEGFLIVGEHQKPTVIVQDWRLPPGWVKHMYQRSNVLGKWDVILVSPSGKRFRSKSDLKVFLESQDLVYNPDVYDFSIHRRRAKDINAYVYTHDYTPQQPLKTKSTPMDVSLDTSRKSNVSATLPSTPATPISSTRSSQYMETPVATLMPPAELMSPQAQTSEEKALADGSVSADLGELGSAAVENGFAYIGGLKVQIMDNLFVCPREGCGKTYRKEDFLQIHIRHYHKEFAEYVSHCPKMQELAVKRTHASSIDQVDQVAPKNQIPNQQFFAKMHQQDVQLSRSLKRPSGVPSIAGAGEGVASSIGTTSPATGSVGIASSISPIKSVEEPIEKKPLVDLVASPNAGNTLLPPSEANSSPLNRNSAKRARLSPPKRTSGSRKSIRQRSMRPSVAERDPEETGQSTPDAGKKRRVPTTPISSIDSPATADSISTPSSNDHDINAALPPPMEQTPQYIKENGELIRIVRMRQEEIINCICEYGEEDGLMIQCELCLCWQHGACNGINKELDVPEKYVCYICRNPQRRRDSMRFKHDQDWLYEGKLPVASYHTANPQTAKQFDLLKRSHTLTGNLLDAKRSMHSLMVKINIARNRCHPKLYLWAKKWDEDKLGGEGTTPVKRPKLEQQTDFPNIPQPEAAIDPEECQYRLIDHVKVQQQLVMNRLNEIQTEMDELEKEDTLTDLKDCDMATTKEAVAVFIKELETLKRLANLNKVANMKQALKDSAIIANTANPPPTI
ncbi:uncharacterized protein Dwil_GK11973 [Drosophila willistoni]|uniref:MBD domain-containing protein n=1 Tax=Drosophila willistoni TaxID=7260 RepID=B4N820_DROWI|nr:uncharacterized protein LOC6647424 [Drosophila willistoni]EDW81271.2 uncharacterized protein Dwil_GK11973 [Drosophila willistoni]